MRSGFWRESTEANNWGACKTRNPRSACLWPGELAQSAVGANSVASRAYVARLPPRCWSIRGARAAREEARASARGDHLGRLGPLAWSSRRAIPWGGHATRLRGRLWRVSLAETSPALAAPPLHRQTACDGVAGTRPRPAGRVCTGAGRPCATPGRGGAPRRPASRGGRSRQRAGNTGAREPSVSGARRCGAA